MDGPTHRHTEIYKSNIIHFKVYLFDLSEDLDHQLNTFYTHYSVSLVRQTRAMAA